MAGILIPGTQAMNPGGEQPQWQGGWGQAHMFTGYPIPGAMGPPIWATSPLGMATPGHHDAPPQDTVYYTHGGQPMYTHFGGAHPTEMWPPPLTTDGRFWREDTSRSGTGGQRPRDEWQRQQHEWQGAHSGQHEGRGGRSWEQHDGRAGPEHRSAPAWTHTGRDEDEQERRRKRRK